MLRISAIILLAFSTLYSTPSLTIQEILDQLRLIPGLEGKSSVFTYIKERINQSDSTDEYLIRGKLFGSLNDLDLITAEQI